MSMVSEADFVQSDHKTMFRTIREIVAQKGTVDMVLLAEEMPLSMDLIVEYSKTLAHPASISQYVESVRMASKRRAMYLLGKRIMDESKSGELTEISEQVRMHMKTLTPTEDDEESLSDIIMSVHEEIYSGKTDTNLKMGLPALDNALHGFEPGGVYVIGARPAVGKSVFGMIASLETGKAGKKALFINREMKKVNVVRRMLSSVSGVATGKIRSGKMSDDEGADLTASYQALSDTGIVVRNKPGTPAQIREAVLKMHEEGGIDLLVIDYLQRLSSGRKTNSRDEEVGAICWAIKNIAMDFDIPVILLSQLNRSASNSRPNMANLRESGNIEQDADAVILLHRPDIDDVPSARKAQYQNCLDKGGVYLEMIVDKNREGETMIAPVMFHGSTMRYYPL